MRRGGGRGGNQRGGGVRGVRGGTPPPPPAVYSRSSTSLIMGHLLRPPYIARGRVRRARPSTRNSVDLQAIAPATRAAAFTTLCRLPTPSRPQPFGGTGKGLRGEWVGYGVWPAAGEAGGSLSPPTQGRSRREGSRGGGGRGVWDPKVGVYQQWPHQIFPTLNFVVSRDGPFGSGGGGGPGVSVLGVGRPPGPWPHRLKGVQGLRQGGATEAPGATSHP